MVDLIFSSDIYWAALIGLAGGLMHGFTGWGGAMVMMPLMSILFGPIQALGTVLIGSMAICSQLVWGASKIADWREMRPLLLAILLSIPIGNYLLFHLEPGLVIRIIGIIIVGAAILQLSGWNYKGPRGPIPASFAGAACGVINGFSGVGGPPLVLYVLAKEDPPDIQRANLIVAVTIISFAVFISLVVGGGVGELTVLRGVIIAPTQIVGAVVGSYLFKVLPENIFKRFSLLMLVLLGILAVIS